MDKQIAVYRYNERLHSSKNNELLTHTYTTAQTIWIYIKGIMLSEGDKHNFNYIPFLNIQNYNDGEQTNDYQRLRLKKEYNCKVEGECGVVLRQGKCCIF